MQRIGTESRSECRESSRAEGVKSNNLLGVEILIPLHLV